MLESSAYRQNTNRTHSIFRLLRVSGLSGFLYLSEYQVIELADQFTGFQGDFHFPFNTVISGINKKLQSVIVFRQIFQKNLFRLTVRLLHIVNKKLREITGHYPPRTFRVWQFRGVTFSLLERRQHRTVRLLDSFSQVFTEAFLLNHNVRTLNIAINKRRMVKYGQV